MTINKNVLRRHHKRQALIKENILFFSFSSLGTVADCALLRILSFVMNETIANVISYPFGVAVAFVLSREYAFKTKDKTVTRIIATIIVHGVGLIVQSALFSYLVKIGLSVAMVKMITIVENAILMYFGNVFIVFRKTKKQHQIWLYSDAFYY